MRAKCYAPTTVGGWLVEFSEPGSDSMHDSLGFARSLTPRFKRQFVLQRKQPQ